MNRALKETPLPDFPPARIVLRQAWVLARASLRTRYRRTWAGFLWVILNPLTLFGAQYILFSQLFDLNMKGYFLFLLSGWIPWFFLNQTLEMSVGALVNSGQLLKGVPVQPLVYVLAQGFDNLINYLSVFVLLLIPVLGNGQVHLIQIPVLLIDSALLFGGVMGTAWLLSMLHVLYRDTRFVVSFSLSVGYFLTPIFYPLSRLNPNLRAIVAFNPLYIWIKPFRISLVEFDWASWLVACGQSFLLSGCLVLFAVRFWKTRRGQIYSRL